MQKARVFNSQSAKMDSMQYLCAFSLIAPHTNSFKPMRMVTFTTFKFPEL